MSASELERRAGDGEAQIRVLRDAFETLDRLGDRFFFSTVTIMLANALAENGADSREIAALCAAARERTIEGDLANDIGLGWADARLRLRSGDVAAAEAIARETLERADATDHFMMRARSRVVLAEVLGRSGQADEARALGAEALSLHEAKGDVAGAAAWRSYLGGAGVTVA